MTVGKTTDSRKRPWTPGKKPGVNTTMGRQPNEYTLHYCNTSPLRKNTVRVDREGRRMTQLTDRTLDNDSSNAQGLKETPRSSQEEGLLTCSTCGKRWPSSQNTASNQGHCRKAQRETREAMLQGQISVRRAKEEMDRFTSTVPIRWEKTNFPHQKKKTT